MRTFFFEIHADDDGDDNRPFRPPVINVINPSLSPSSPKGRLGPFDPRRDHPSTPTSSTRRPTLLHSTIPCPPPVIPPPQTRIISLLCFPPRQAPALITACHRVLWLRFDPLWTNEIQLPDPLQYGTNRTTRIVIRFLSLHEDESRYNYLIIGSRIGFDLLRAKICHKFFFPSIYRMCICLYRWNPRSNFIMSHPYHLLWNSISTDLISC